MAAAGSSVEDAAACHIQPPIITNGSDSDNPDKDINAVSEQTVNGDVLNEDGSPSHSTALLSPTTIALPCEVCRNYEASLTKLQDSERNLKEKLAAAQHLADRYQTELSGERLYRNELESKMNMLCSDSEKEAKALAVGNEECSLRLQHAEERFEKLLKEQRKKLYMFRERFQQMDGDMEKLSQKYLKLLGINRKCATEMQAQPIELPQDADQLQFLCLQLREELIETRASKEHMEAVLRDEITMLQVQRREDSLEKQRLEQALTEQVNGVSEELGIARSELSTLHFQSQRVEEMDKRMAEYRAVIEELEKQVKSIQNERTDLEMQLSAYKQKCSALQHELDTSETVQKDFVKLSQNLQIELEKIRQAEQEVRWQFDEDVNACNQCHNSFFKSRSKLHCQHCGKIFCSVCLNLTVPSGPHGRPAKVCQVCHTLLIRDTAPFFSHSTRDVQ